MTHFVLIPLIPLLASFIILIGGHRWGEKSHLIGIPAIGLSFALSVAAFIEVLINGPFTISLYRLFESGSLVIDLTLFVDQLTVLLLLLVTGVSGVVHVYSSRYMLGESRYNRFFAVIALFTSSMISLVMSGNLLMLLISWEVMGICSYMLISHAAERPSACRAATKAFIVNALADIGLTFGIILTFLAFGTLDIQTILAQAEGMQSNTINILGWIGLDFYIDPLSLIPFFLFMGAMGKSAQLPFHVWLPLAMEAPSPVSALIHAATMVNAGPFLLVRLSPLIILSPSAMTFITIIGITTAIFAGMVSLTQSDIKKILAYSTISQIGFMVMACGLGAFAVAIFHLLAHGCYKAFFFLSTGNALRSVEPGHRHNDHEPHLSEGMEILYGGALLLALIPPFILFSGSYEYLWGITGFVSASIGFKIIALITIFVASQYLFKGVTSLFVLGPKTYWPNSGENSLKVSSIRPQLLNGSIITGLFLGTVVVGWALTLLWAWFADFLAPALAISGVKLVEGTRQDGFSFWLVVSLGIAVLGWIYAYLTHIRPQGQVSRINKRSSRWYVLFWNKGYFDEIYDTYLITPTNRFASWLWKNVDIKIIDRFVHFFATSSVDFARWLWRIVDINWLDKKVGQAAEQINDAGKLLKVIESRTIQHQLLVMIFWLVAMTGLLYNMI
jgi:NADH-quinone oxidoreductase subunit L